jgi:hypothetical protein
MNPIEAFVAIGILLVMLGVFCATKDPPSRDDE